MDGRLRLGHENSPSNSTPAPRQRLHRKRNESIQYCSQANDDYWRSPVSISNVGTRDADKRLPRRSTEKGTRHAKQTVRHACGSIGRGNQYYSGCTTRSWRGLGPQRRRRRRELLRASIPIPVSEAVVREDQLGLQPDRQILTAPVRYPAWARPILGNDRGRPEANQSRPPSGIRTAQCEQYWTELSFECGASLLSGVLPSGRTLG